MFANFSATSKDKIMEKAVTTASAREELRMSEFSPPLSHYTDAVRFGDLLFISGIVALDAAGNLIGKDDPVVQTEYILKCMQKVLDRADMDFGDVLKVTVFLTDISHRTIINPTRIKYFGDSKPASTLVEVSKLAVPGVLVEIEAVAGSK